MKTVLIVEDMALNRDLLEQLLEDDYHVITAADGVAGLDVARQQQPDLILMDLSLPVMDGWDATRCLRADPELKTIPVIALTAHAMRGDEERALAAGCDAYLSKPIDEDRLLSLLEQFLDDSASSSD